MGTDNVKSAAHPFATRDYYGDNQYILVHNGYIENSDELFVEHQEKGMEYKSLDRDLKYTDTESLLWDFAESMEHDKDLTAVGAIAFVCVKLHKGKLDKLYFARNSLRPLKLNRDKQGISLSSEGEGEDIETGTLYTWNYKLKRLTTKNFDIPTYKRWEPLKSYSHQSILDDSLTDDDVRWFRGKRKYYRQQQLLSPPKQQMSDDDILEVMEIYEPRVADIEKLAFDYMNVSNGHYESAVHNLELDYIERETEAKTLSDYKRLRKLERALTLIENDPSYIDENSVNEQWVNGGQG